MIETTVHSEVFFFVLLKFQCYFLFAYLSFFLSPPCILLGSVIVSLKIIPLMNINAIKLLC